MSTVKITDSLVDNIGYNFRLSFDAERDALSKYPDKLPIGVGDELYSLLWPLEEEKKVRAALPTWAIIPMREVGVYTPNGYRVAKFSETRMSLGRSPVLTPKGFSYFRLDGNSITYEVSDVEAVEIPLFKKYLQDCKTIAKEYVDFEASVDEEVKKLEVFLNNHRTLQQAVEAFGESLMTFVPQRMKNQYYAKDEPKEKKPEAEKVEVDIGSLVARATAEALGMTDNNKADQVDSYIAPRRSRRNQYATLPVNSTAKQPVLQRFTI